MARIFLTREPRVVEVVKARNGKGKLGPNVARIALFLFHNLVTLRGRRRTRKEALGGSGIKDSGWIGLEGWRWSALSSAAAMDAAAAAAVAAAALSSLLFFSHWRQKAAREARASSLLTRATNLATSGEESSLGCSLAL